MPPNKLIYKNIPSAQNFANSFGGAIILTKSSALQQVDNVLVDSAEIYDYRMQLKGCVFCCIIELKIKLKFYSFIFDFFQQYVQKKRFLQKQLLLQIKNCIPQQSKTFKYFIEFPSSQVYGSVVYPTKEWELLGKFYAEDSNEWQIFNLEQRFLRYLKIHIVDFHNAEFHCTLTQIRVFGQTVIGDIIDSHKRDKKITKPETKTENSTQEQQEINLKEVSEVVDRSNNDTCSVVDYFYTNQPTKRIESQYINVLPYESRQSLFKVTAQNILILSHNVELFKNEINQIKQQDLIYLQEQEEIRLFQSQLINSIQEQKQVNQKLEDELEFLNRKLSIMFFLLGVIAIILFLINFCNYQNKQSTIEHTRVSTKTFSTIIKSQPELLTPQLIENDFNRNAISQIKIQNGKSKKQH